MVEASNALQHATAGATERQASARRVRAARPSAPIPHVEGGYIRL